MVVYALEQCWEILRHYIMIMLQNVLKKIKEAGILNSHSTSIHHRSQQLNISERSLRPWYDATPISIGSGVEAS